MGKIKYCALTTISGSLKSFVIPALDCLSENGYDITVSCAHDEEFKKEMQGKYPYFELDIERGFNLPKTIKTICCLSRFFKKEKFQMIEYGTENVALCASIAGWITRVPVRIYNHWGARYVGLQGVSRIVSIWVERLAAAFSTDVRQVSPKNAEMCVKQRLYPAKKMKVIGKGGTIGVDFTKFDCSKKEQYRKDVLDKYGLPEDAFIYGYVGRIQRDKGTNELISAFKKILEAKDAYLFLVGNIDKQNSVDEEKMEWAKNCSRVIFTGTVNDVYRYMSAFDVLVHPTYREGFGMVLQEAAAMKTPIITTDIMGPGEFIQNGVTGILVESKNENALFTAMEKTYKSYTEIERLAENDYKYVCEHFERNVMVKRILEDRELLRKRMR